nr:hypothetical protein Iba_chr12cCG13550 [Ipomoea batatas]
MSLLHEALPAEWRSNERQSRDGSPPLLVDGRRRVDYDGRRRLQQEVLTALRHCSAAAGSAMAPFLLPLLPAKPASGGVQPAAVASGNGGNQRRSFSPSAESSSDDDGKQLRQRWKMAVNLLLR